MHVHPGLLTLQVIRQIGISLPAENLKASIFSEISVSGVQHEFPTQYLSLCISSQEGLGWA